MGPPFPPPLGSSLVFVSLCASLMGHWWVLDLSESRWAIQDGRLFSLIGLESFGAKTESSQGIGSQILAGNHFQTGPVIGPEKMTKKKGGKMKFSPVPPLTLSKLIFYIFSARKIIKQVEMIFFFLYLTFFL